MGKSVYVTVTGEIKKADLCKRKPFDPYIGRYSPNTEFDDFYGDFEIQTESGSVYFKSSAIQRRVASCAVCAIVTFSKDETAFMRIVGDVSVAEPGKPSNTRCELKYKVGDVITVEGRLKSEKISRVGKPYKVITHVKLTETQGKQ